MKTVKSQAVSSSAYASFLSAVVLISPFLDDKSRLSSNIPGSVVRTLPGVPVYMGKASASADAFFCISKITGKASGSKKAMSDEQKRTPRKMEAEKRPADVPRVRETEDCIPKP